MKKLTVTAALLIASVFLAGASAEAWHVEGVVLCDANGNGIADTGDLPLAGVSIRIVGPDGYDVTVTTAADGFYAAEVHHFPHTLTVTIGQTAAPVIGPTSVSGTLTADVVFFKHDFLVSQGGCTGPGELKCWLTGGGTKFSPLIGMQVAEKGPVHNFGGNVNPSCSAEPGDGGQWNHVAHNVKRHFQGTSIRVVACGNVPDPAVEPGSESPVTPFNFIEFEGTGWVKGVQGNKESYDFVTFFARAEDRNEPGSHGAKDGVDIDRYFLRVDNPTNPASPLILVDLDANQSTVDPVTITGGNLQLHISSCTQ